MMCSSYTGTVRVTDFPDVIFHSRFHTHAKFYWMNRVLNLRARVLNSSLLTVEQPVETSLTSVHWYGDLDIVKVETSLTSVHWYSDLDIVKVEHKPGQCG